MFYEPRLRNHGLLHDPFNALIAPRPIGWIASRGADGAVNLAPYSYFNAFSSHPPIVGFSSYGIKDSVANIGETGEFVCNIVTLKHAEAMNQTSAPYPRGVNEFAKAGLTMEASKLVKVPRIAGVAAALECKLSEIIQLKDKDGASTTSFLVLGEVIGIHVDPAFIVGGRIDTPNMLQLARLGYMEYAAVAGVFSMERPQI